MSEKTNKEFDATVRSMMQNAQVEVPSRVWEAVSARTAARRRPVARYALPLALAAAASLALVFFLHPESVGQPSAAVLALSDSPLVDVGYPGAPCPLPLLRPASGAGYVSVSPGLVPDGQDRQTSLADGPASAVEPEAAPVAVRHSESAAPVPSSSSSSDLFAQQMSLDDERVTTPRKPQFIFKASMCGSEGSPSAPAKGSSGISFAGAGKGITETSVSTYGVPFTLGAAVRFEVLPKFSIGTGIDWSMLTRTFSADYSDASLVRSGEVLHTMHYLGIPLVLSYKIVSTGSLSFYVDGGGRIEWCVSNRYDFRDADFRATLRNPVRFPQASASLGLGAEYAFAEHFSLYLEPAVRYYFYCSQPKNQRTERPFMFDLSLGVRFSL